ncbi:Sulfonamide resistance protein [Candidatus Rubidus massiliensis]|nr:Sulfonamide resistance protein [Candidatus Rubidus massiliensis]
MNKEEIKFIFILFIITIPASIETDVYFPSFPDMMNFFQVRQSEIQKIVSWNLIGFSLACLIIGPLSDSYGRKKPLIISLMVFFIGSIFTIYSKEFNEMLFGRFLQGVGSGGTISLGTALIFDFYKEKKAITALNLLNFIVAIFLISAPIIGAYFNIHYGFRSNFVLIGGLVLFCLVISVFLFQETLPKNKRLPLKIPKLITNFQIIFSNINFWLLIIITSIIFGGYVAFLTQISILYVEEFGVSKQDFPLYQASLLACYLIGSFTCALFINKFSTLTIKKIGTIALGLTALAIVIYLFIEPSPKNPFIISFLIVPYALGFAWHQTPYMEELINLNPSFKGLVASFITSFRLLCTVLIVEVVARMYNSTIFPAYYTLLVIITLVTIITIVLEKRK